jgi:hypothetical protein
MIEETGPGAPSKTDGRLSRPARYFTLQLAELAERDLDRKALSADSRAHRATRVASDVIERPAEAEKRVEPAWAARRYFPVARLSRFGVRRRHRRAPVG